MKQTLKLLKQDLKYQTCKKYFYFIPVILLAIYMCIDMNSMLKQEGRAFSFGSYLAYVFNGTQEYIKDIHPFEIKPDFMLIHIILAYVTAYYPVRDLKMRGHQIFIRTGRTQNWWYAKFIWLLINVTVYYIVLIFSVMIYAKNTNIVPDTAYMKAVGELASGISATKYFIYLICLPYLTSCMMCILQMTLSLITAPIYGFMTVVFLLLISTFSFSKFFPGNFLMVNRMEIAREGGVFFGHSAVICLITIIICFIAGRIYMKRRDIL